MCRVGLDTLDRESILHLRGLLGRDNLTPFEDDAVRREGDSAQRMYMVLVSTHREMFVRHASGALAIIRTSCCVQLATGIGLMSTIITLQGVYMECARVCWRSSEKECVFNHDLYTTSFEARGACATIE